MAVILPVSAPCAANVTDASGEILIEDVAHSDIPELVKYLKRAGSRESDLSKDILIEFGEDSVPELLKALSPGEGFQEVVTVLRSIRDERAIEPLSAYINSDDWSIANPSRGALRSYGNAAVPVLAGLLKKPDYSGAAVDVLKDIEPSEESLKTVRQMLHSGDPGEKSAAAVVLGHWRDEVSAKDIAGLFGDTDAKVRAAALEGYRLLYRDDEQSYDLAAVLPFLEDEDATVRRNASYIFRSKPDVSYIKPLLDRLNVEKDIVVSKNLITAIGDTGSGNVVFPLIEYMEAATDSSLVTNVLYSLGELKAKEAVPFIVEMLTGEKEAEAPVAQEAFMALEKIGEPVDLKPFLKYLKHGDPHYTATGELMGLIEAQAKPGDEKIIEALKDFRAGEDNPYAVRSIDALLEKLEQ